MIKRGERLTDGNIPLSQVQAQVDVLNADYVETGLKFKLIETDYTTSTSWFANADACNNSTQYAMKKALRKGGAEALNVYSYVLML